MTPAPTLSPDAAPAAPPAPPAPAPPPAPPAAPEVEMFVTLDAVDWELYEAIDRSRGDKAWPCLLYLDRSLTLVSPLGRHEKPAHRLDHLITTICSELDIPCVPTARTTYRRRDKGLGVEADATFYLEHAAWIAGRGDPDDDVDLEAGDPPPDLAIEVELTHPARRAVAIWQALGTPEVWIFRPRTKTVAFLVRDAEGRLVESPASRAFPFLTAAEIVAWSIPTPGELMNRWDRRLRAWVRDELARRVAR